MNVGFLNFASREARYGIELVKKRQKRTEMSKRFEINMRKFLITALLSIAIGAAGQGMLKAQTANLKIQELELAKMAEIILRSDSTDLKFELLVWL